MFNRKTCDSNLSCLNVSWRNTSYLYHRYVINLVLMHVFLFTVKYCTRSHRYVENLQVELEVEFHRSLFAHFVDHTFLKHVSLMLFLHVKMVHSFKIIRAWTKQHHHLISLIQHKAFSVDMQQCVSIVAHLSHGIFTNA